MDENPISMWMGRRISELSREELIEVVNYCAKEIANLSADKARWMKAADPIKYLMDT